VFPSFEEIACGKVLKKIESNQVYKRKKLRRWVTLSITKKPGRTEKAEHGRL
jgi:hypothetical protein